MDKKKELVEVKKPWASKTNWVALIMALLAFFPSAGTWVANHPEPFMWAVSGVIAGLRMISKGKIAIK